MHLAYSAGRIASYAAAGAIMGLIGGAGLMFNHILPVQLLFYVLANLVLVGLGLYLAGLGNRLARLESLGAWLWRRVQPYSARFVPVDTVAKAFALGTLWGWLPCGLVYSVLATALVSGRRRQRRRRDAGVWPRHAAQPAARGNGVQAPARNYRQSAPHGWRPARWWRFLASPASPGLPIWASISGKDCYASFDRRIMWPES